MARARWAQLTPPPSVPVLMRVATVGALATAPVGCGDDDGDDMDGMTDVHPTAGPCAHDPDAPDCEDTTTGPNTGATGTTGTTGSGMTTDDAHPTTPCAHDPDAPGCGTGDSGPSGDTGTDTSG